MIWITRGKQPKLNRHTGQIADGDFASRVTGPDGKTNSGLKFDGISFLMLPINTDLESDFTIQFGYKR